MGPQVLSNLWVITSSAHVHISAFAGHHQTYTYDQTRWLIKVFNRANFWRGQISASFLFNFNVFKHISHNNNCCKLQLEIQTWIVRAESDLVLGTRSPPQPCSSLLERDKGCIGPSGKLLCIWQKNQNVGNIQIHVWLLSWSGCSSTST